MKHLLQFWTMVSLATATTWAGDLENLGSVKFKGDISKAKDLSALVLVDDLLVIGSDETNKVQILKRDGDRYVLMPNRDVELNDSGDEIDIEGIACEGRTVYVVGSHSYIRKKLKDEEPYENNRDLIEIVDCSKARDRLYRFSLDSTGHASSIDKTTLRPVLDSNPVLKTFRRVPSKENGIDIEGIAVHEGQLYIGFRGPVLRENYVPILKCKFEDPVTQASLLFVNLGGRGVRDLARVQSGFLILAGPVGDGPGSYQLYFWDGQDGLPGVRNSASPPPALLLCSIPTTAEEAKAEGLTILRETNDSYEFLIVFDGIKDGGATRFRLTKS